MRALVTLLLVGAVVLAVASVPVLLMAPDDDVTSADAVVVLAGDESRLPVAVSLVRRGVAPVLLVSTDSSDEPRARLCEAGTTGYELVCREPVPYSTRGEARMTDSLARERGWDSVVVVTSRFHVRRTRMLFDRCLDADVAVYAAPNPSWSLLESVPLEWAKLARDGLTERGC